MEGVKEQEAEIDTSGQNVQKSELEKQEQETSDNTLEDGDEIIDLGDEKEQVLADMKKSLEIGEEPNLPFRLQTAISVSKRWMEAMIIPLWELIIRRLTVEFMTIRM